MGPQMMEFMSIKGPSASREIAKSPCVGKCGAELIKSFPGINNSTEFPINH